MILLDALSIFALPLPLSARRLSCRSQQSLIIRRFPHFNPCDDEVPAQFDQLFLLPENYERTTLPIRKFFFFGVEVDLISGCCVQFSRKKCCFLFPSGEDVFFFGNWLKCDAACVQICDVERIEALWGRKRGAILFSAKSDNSRINFDCYLSAWDQVSTAMAAVKPLITICYCCDADNRFNILFVPDCIHRNVCECVDVNNHKLAHIKRQNDGEGAEGR